MVFTLNEELHLPICLEYLQWCDDIIIIDSFSTDTTEQVAKKFGARFFQNKFEGFGSQRNWALDNIEIKHDWVLVLDADEKVPDALVRELNEVANNDLTEYGAWRLRRRFHMWGEWLRYSSLYPTWVVRFIHKDKVRYINRGHAETQQVEGMIGDLANDLIDENMKGMHEWFERQNRYTTKDAEFELSQQGEDLRFLELFLADPLARRATVKRIALRLPFRPLLYFMYSYFWRLGFLDGRKGFMLCMLKAECQRMVVIKKYSISLSRNNTTE